MADWETGRESANGNYRLREGIPPDLDIARQLSLPEEVQHKVWIGALLHDVGKIGVEDQILKKTGVLTPEEYDQMKLHTVMGAEILSKIEQLKEMVPAVDPP